ncbi:Poly [ADP-ribose] polymerase 1 [Borealophlyctis nickersoniae]|nr:Poly [ADP-ribose] polymerase 1 [Borealophlyctis nickersoniae]
MSDKKAGDFEVEYAKVANLTFPLGKVFKKKNAKNLAAAEDLHGFSDLRWEDQEKVRKHVEGDGGGGGGAGGGTGGGKAKKGCDEKIQTGELRVAFMMDNENGRFPPKIPAWHHPACFFENFSDKVSDVDDFDGVSLNTIGSEDLKKYDRDVLAAFIAGEEPPAPPEEGEDKDDSKEKQIGNGKGKKGAGKKGKGSRKVEEDDEEAEDDEEQDTKKRGRGKATKAAAKTRRQKKAEDESDEEDEEEEDIKGKKSGRGKAKKAPAKSRKRKADDEEDEEEEENDEEDQKPPPKRKKGSTAEKKPSKAGKGKATASDEQETPATEDPLIAKLRDQTKAIWEIRDKIKKSGHSRLKALCLNVLERNDIHAPTHHSEDVVIGYVADLMLFGRTQMCPECGKSRLIPKEYQYECPAHTEWAACSYSTTEPKFEKIVIPEDMELEWFEGYKWKPRERVFREKRVAAAPASDMRAELVAKRAEAATRVIDTAEPFKMKVFAFAGKLSHNQSYFQKLVEEGGGIVSKSVSKDVTMLITNKAEVDKNSNKIQQAEEWGIDVVDEAYVTDCMEQKKRFYHKDAKYLLVGHSKEVSSISAGEKKRRAEGLEEERSAKISKVTVKGGAAVDPESGLESTHHVLKEDKLLWSVVLSKTDLQKGKNSYYKLQVLESDKGGSCRLFRSWGRVGTTVGGNKCESMDKRSAKAEFRRLYTEKCGNEFGDPNPVKHPGLMFPLEVDFGDDDDFGQKSNVVAGSRTKLDKPIQDLMKVIFDVQAMRATLKEMEIDLTKMPLGRISKNMIKGAYQVLSEASAVLDEQNAGSSTGKIVSLSNQFFTMVPHDFGNDNAPLLNNKEIIQSKITLLDTLSDMEIAQTLLQSGDEQLEEDPIDVHYKSLKTHMEVVDRDSEEFKLIEECTKTTHAPTHTNYTLVLEDVFRIVREGERERFEGYAKLHNRKLLWHGSRLTNYAGILSQGLRIAPPEAPVTGYMFGKGIYFADMVSKSANYCFASSGSPTGILLLSEVALGDMYEKLTAEYVEKLPKGKHSTKGCGSTGPTKFVPLPADPEVELPLGPPTNQTLPSGSARSSLLYNEYIVYDVNQVNIRYLLKVRFDYGRRR